MRDIYHQLVKLNPDFREHSDDALIECTDICGEAVRGITSALTLIGNLTLDATSSEDYSDEDAKRDLMLLGNTLRCLPRMAQALDQSANTANYVLRQRRGEQQ
jgi:hypothetical protein